MRLAHIWSPLKFLPAGHMRVIVFQGTSHLGKLIHLYLRRGYVVIVIDNAKEIAPYERRLSGEGNVHFFALGNGQTAMTLLGNPSAEVKRCLKKMANMRASTGAGQLHEFGHAASAQLVQSTQFRRFFKRLLKNLDRKAGGNLKHIELVFLIGLAGGTGPSVLPVSKYMAETCLLDKSITVHSHFETLGPRGFITLGDRTELMGAAALADISAYVIRHDHDPRHTLSMNGLESPPCGPDQEARNAFLLADEQAFTCTALKDHFDRVDPNHSPDSEYGNITIRHTQYSSFLSSDKVASQIGPIYLAEVEAALKRIVSNPSLVLAFGMREGRHGLSREPLPSIVATAADRQTDDVLTALRRPEAELQFLVRAELANGSEYELSTYSNVAVTTPPTLSEVVEHAVNETSLSDVLSREIQLLEENLGDLDSEIEELNQQTTTAHRAVRPETAFERMRYGFLSIEPRARHFAICAPLLRAACDKRHRLMAELTAMRHAREEVAKVLAFRHQRIADICNALADHRPRGRTGDALPLVEPEHIDVIWSKLTDFDRVSRQEQTERLWQGVAAVTKAGLACLVGSADDQPESIARKVAEGNYATVGPYWGGVERHDGSERFVILPPVAPDLRTSIVSLVKESDPQLQVAFADYATACATIVQFTIFRVSGASELFTGRLADALTEAVHSPLAPMFFPRGLECLEILGIEWDENRNIRFTK